MANPAIHDLAGTLICAAFVAPMDAPVIEDGAVFVSGGLIKAVGPQTTLRRNCPQAALVELGQSLLTPGLVNAHVHLELSDLSRGAPPAGFVQWIMDLMAQTVGSGENAGERVRHAVESGVRQCLRFGVTTVGDISKHCMFSRPALKELPIRAISFGEIQAMAKRRGLLEERFAIASDITHDNRRLRTGISPHAPYTVEPDGYAKCLTFAKTNHRVLATHLAENPEEAIFLSDQTGPFRTLWEIGVNAWDENVPRFSGGPIRYARHLGLLDHPTLLAHVNFCDDDELAILAGGKASVVYCPRTHAYFGHAPHRWRDMLARGINVAVGTDSCASSPDLNLLDDLRLLHQFAPEIPALDLWRLATTRAAKALCMQDQIGSLTPGNHADIAAFPSGAGDPLLNVLESAAVPTRLWIDGEPIALPD